MATKQTHLFTAQLQKRSSLDIRPGDMVVVSQKIQEKGKVRIQDFRGVVLARKHGAENGATITVRKVSNGVGVEKIFPIYSPVIESIRVIRRAKVRKAKLGFLRDVSSKKISAKLRRHRALPDNTIAADDDVSDLIGDQEDTNTPADSDGGVVDNDSTTNNSTEDKATPSDQTSDPDDISSSDDTSTTTSTPNTTENQDDKTSA